MPADSNLMFYTLELQARQPKPNHDCVHMHTKGVGKKCRKNCEEEIYEAFVHDFPAF